MIGFPKNTLFDLGGVCAVFFLLIYGCSSFCKEADVPGVITVREVREEKYRVSGTPGSKNQNSGKADSGGNSKEAANNSNHEYETYNVVVVGFAPDPAANKSDPKGLINSERRISLRPEKVRELDIAPGKKFRVTAHQNVYCETSFPTEKWQIVKAE